LFISPVEFGVTIGVLSCAIKLEKCLLSYGNYINHSFTHDTITVPSMNYQLYFSGFKKDVVPAKPATVAKAKPVGSSLGNWSMSKAGSKSKVVRKPAPPPKKPSTNIFASIFDKVEDTKTEEKVIVPPRSIISSIFEEKSRPPETSEDAVIADVVESEEDKVTITKVFDFAGESVE